MIRFVWFVKQDSACACVRLSSVENYAKRKLATVKQLLHSIRMWGTTKELKMQLFIYKCWKV